MPAAELLKNLGEATKQEIKLYQELIGSIFYTAIMIRLDIAYAVSQLSKFLTNSSREHFKAALHAPGYLYATRFVAIVYGPIRPGAPQLLIAGDASFASDEETRKSSHGFIFMLMCGPIH